MEHWSNGKSEKWIGGVMGGEQSEDKGQMTEKTGSEEWVLGAEFLVLS